MTDEKPQNAQGEAAPPATPPPLPQAAIDPRRHAVRPDLAALSLRGQVAAPRYAAGIIRQIARPAVPLRREPNPALGLETEALYGELVRVYDEAEGWAWVQAERDRYVGYLPAAALTGEI
ncbi:MAG: peptidase P60, partial [Hyphomicrobium sp.]|nr:peptidase P60 [Hyphomicrobium sp.]